MIKFLGPTPTIATVVVAMNAVMMTTQLDTPTPNELYRLNQVSATHSDVAKRMRQTFPLDDFATRIAAIYSDLAIRQEPLGAEFEAAMFADIESLYEA
jgi:hypothetical protein